MPAISIDLDDQASAGITNLENLIDRLGQASAGAVHGADALSAAQSKGLTITERQDVSYKKLAETGIRTFGDIADAGIHAFVELETAGTKAAVEVANTAIKVAGSVAKVAVVSGAAAYTAIRLFGDRHKKVVDEMNQAQDTFGERILGTAKNFLIPGAAVATLGAQYGLMGKAAEAAAGVAIKSLLGISPYAAGAVLAVKGMETVWANTGLRMVELADGSKKMESNWDRISDAGSKMGQSVTRDLKEAGQAIRSMMDIQIQWPDLWSEIDLRATRAADNLEKNIGGVNKLYDEAGVYFRHYVLGLGETVEAERNATNSMRELDASISQLTQKLQSQADGYRLLKEANKEMADAAAGRAEAQRIASIKTTSGMDAEIAKVRERAKSLIESGKFDEDAQKAYTTTITALTNQRINVARLEAEALSKGHGAFMVQSAEELKAMDDQIKKSGDLFDLRKKQQQEFASLQKGLRDTQRKQDDETGMAAAKGQHAAQKDMVSERMKAQGAEESAIKIQLAEMDKAFSAAEHQLKTNQINDEAREKIKAIMDERENIERTVTDETEKRKALIKSQMDEERARADRIKKQLEENGKFERDQNKLTNDQRMVGQQALFAAERERIQKAAALEKEQAQKSMAGFDAQNFVNQQDPAKVRKQFIADQAEAAKKAQSERDQDMGFAAMGGDQQALRQFTDNQKRAMTKAKRQAADSFDNGTADQGQVDQSAGKVAQQTIGNFQTQGQINDNQAQLMSTALQTLNDQQTSMTNMIVMQGRMLAFQQGQSQVARKQSQVTQNLQGTLGQ